MVNLHSNLPKTLLDEKNIILLIIHIFIMYINCKHVETVFVDTTILAMNVNFVKLVFFGCLNNAYISVIVYLAQQVCKNFS